MDAETRYDVLAMQAGAPSSANVFISRLKSEDEKAHPYQQTKVQRLKDSPSARVNTAKKLQKELDKTIHDVMIIQDGAPSSSNVLVSSLKTEDEKGYRYQLTKVQRLKGEERVNSVKKLKRIGKN